MKRQTRQKQDAAAKQSQCAQGRVRDAGDLVFGWDARRRRGTHKIGALCCDEDAGAVCMGGFLYGRICMGEGEGERVCMGGGPSSLFTMGE